MNTATNGLLWRKILRNERFYAKNRALGEGRALLETYWLCLETLDPVPGSKLAEGGDLYPESETLPVRVPGPQ